MTRENRASGAAGPGARILNNSLAGGHCGTPEGANVTSYPVPTRAYNAASPSQYNTPPSHLMGTIHSPLPPWRGQYIPPPLPPWRGQYGDRSRTLDVCTICGVDAWLTLEGQHWRQYKEISTLSGQHARRRQRGAGPWGCHGITQTNTTLIGGRHAFVETAILRRECHVSNGNKPGGYQTSMLFPFFLLKGWQDYQKLFTILVVLNNQTGRRHAFV